MEEVPGIARPGSAIAVPFPTPSIRVGAWAPVAAIGALFVALAFAYSIEVPAYESPDERAHVAYVESLAYDGELPGPEDTHQAQHPPLYYGIEAGVVAALGLDRPRDLPANPEFVQPTQARENQPAYLHDGESSWSGGLLTVHVMRGVTVIFGLGVVVLAYLIATFLFPGRKWLALSTAATAALVPQFAFLSAMVNNDVPAAFFATLCVYGGLRFMKSAETGWLLASAVALGLAVLVKSAAAIVVIVPLAAVLTAPALPARQRFYFASLVLAAPLALAGWYYLRNVIVWGEVFAADGYTVALAPRGLGDPIYRGQFLDQLFNSYWYRGGMMNIGFSAIVYRSLYVVVALAVAGLLVAVRRADLDALQTRAAAVLAALPVLAVVSVLAYCVLQDWGPQGRYFFPAQAGIALLLALGVNSVFSRDGKSDHPALLGLPAVLLAMNVWVLAVTLPGVY